MEAFPPEGILPNVLRWIDRPGQVARNLLAGHPGAAGRQALDFLGEIPDAVIPGDWIPQQTKPEDYISGSELVGFDKNDSGFDKTLADIAVGTVTDPLSFLSFGATGAIKGAKAAIGTGNAIKDIQGAKLAARPTYGVKVGLPFMPGKDIPGLDNFSQPVDPLSLAMRGADTGIKKGLGAIDRATQSKTVAGVQNAPLSQGYENIKGTIRRATASEDVSDAVKAAMGLAHGIGNQSSKAFTAQAEALLKGVPQDERTLAAQAVLGIDAKKFNGGQGLAVGLTNNVNANAATLAQAYGKDPAKIQALANGIVDIGKRQKEEALATGAFSNATGPGGRENYVQRQWMLPEDPMANLPGVSGSHPNALKETALKTPNDVADFLNRGDTGLELDPAKLLADRSLQQGEMVKRANLAKQLGGQGTLAEGDLIKSAKENIEQEFNKGTLNKDEVEALHTALDGMPARSNVIFKALATANRFVKGAMVSGAIIPKVGSLVRNRIGMPMQVMGQPGAEAAFLNTVRPDKIVADLFYAGDEAYGKLLTGGSSVLKSDEISRDINLVDQAFKSAKNGGDVGKFLVNAGRQDLADAVKHGVLDGFVSSEEVVRRIANDPNKQKWLDLYQAPSVAFQAVEQRARLQAFKDLLPKSGAAEAARLTKGSMYDYGVSSEANRNLRDVIPFAQFAVKAIPSQASLLSKTPAVAAALSPLFTNPGGGDQALYPYMQSQSHVDVGKDSNGNELYLSGFGLPVESIGMLPNPSGNLHEIGRSISQGLLGSTQPLIKTGAEIATGQDAFFGTPLGSFDKIPLVGHAGNAGRAYNVLAGTGFLEPLGNGALRQLGQATDETKPIGTRLADLMTGAKLTAVDPEMAEQQAITNYLEGNPDVNQYRTFYQSGEKDPEFADLMKALRESKARSKEKRAAAAAASP